MSRVSLQSLPEISTAGDAAVISAAPKSFDVDNAESEAKKGVGAKRLAIAVAVLLVALVGVYAWGVWYFADKFVPGTKVNGTDVSYQTPAELAAEVDAMAANWSLGVTSDGGFSLTMGAQDVGLTVDSAGYVNSITSQIDSKCWPLYLISPKSYTSTAAISYDEGTCAMSVGAAVDTFNESAEGPSNAYAAFDEESGTFVVVPDALGTELDKDVVVEQAQSVVSSMGTELALGEDALVKPQITASDGNLIDACDKANAMLAMEIPVERDGMPLATINRDVSRAWVSIDEDMNVNIDTQAISDWAWSTFGSSVGYEDDEHVYAFDATQFVSFVSAALEENMGSSIEAPIEVVKTKPAVTAGASERGRHIDVNLATQYARMYNEEGSVIWESYIVSGNTSEGRNTPTGTFSINNKATDQTLVGADEDGDGEPDYKSKVSYWMCFLGTSYGLHDATWRSNFGGTIYSSSGSHGCINLPYSAAQQLYNLVNVGDTVIVHT